MITSQDVHGVIPALVTPFDDNENLDEAGLRRITRHVLDRGVHGVMTTGGNGEFPHLMREEKLRVIQIIVDEAGGRVPVIAGTAACSTREAILLAEDAKDAGADAIIVTPPYYFRLPDASLYQFYCDVAAATPLPFVLYNNPVYTGNPLSPQLLARLAELPSVVGLKQSESDVGQLVEVIRLVGDSISVCTGTDSLFYPGLCVGAKGVFSASGLIVPRQLVALYDDFRAGRHAEASLRHHQLQALNRFLEYDPGYVGPCKDALRLLGLPAGRVRAPLPEVTSSIHEELRQVLADMGESPV